MDEEFIFLNCLKKQILLGKPKYTELHLARVSKPVTARHSRRVISQNIEIRVSSIWRRSPDL